ncbi:MAG TPA: HAMP domain-containing sensor histidine kinase [Stellaceae bacterium]|nr:HAMP domain-containing sensor histidine kinase [Stellaceae bacterium]
MPDDRLVKPVTFSSAPTESVPNKHLPPEVRRQLVDILYMSRTPMFLTYAITLALPIVLWQQLPLSLTVGWTSLLFILLAARLAIGHLYHRVRPTAERAARWVRLYSAAITLSGIAWGVTALFLLQLPDPSQHMLTIFGVTVLGGALATTYAAHPPTVNSFILTAILPLAVGCGLRADGNYLTIGALILVYAAHLYLTTRTTHRKIIHGLMVNYDKDRLTQELMEATARTELASRAKSDFLATMSHELRTPLNAIIGFSEVMAHGYFGPLGSMKYEEYARDIHSSANHLLSLISDILDSAKVEAGKYVLDEVSVDLVAVGEQAFRLVRDLAQQKGIMLSIDAKQMPLVFADERAIRQIFLNLLSNAVKFTRMDGRIDVVIGLSARGAPLIQVRDTGIGIPEADMGGILGNYHRASNAYLSGDGGTGLGLPIVRSLVTLHGGELEITSQEGVGTLVTIRLPKARMLSMKPSPAHEPEPPKGDDDLPLPSRTFVR